MKQEPHRQSEEKEKPKGPMAVEREQHTSLSSGTTVTASTGDESTNSRPVESSQTEKSLSLRIRILKQLGFDDIQELNACDTGLVEPIFKRTIDKRHKRTRKDTRVKSCETKPDY